MHQTIVFKSKKIITMDPNRPVASHVAVRDGKILAVGNADCADPWGGGEPDSTFSDAVLMPGFVEGHAHVLAGGLWDFAYAGFHDRLDPKGCLWKGMRDIDDVVRSLKAYAETLEPGVPLIGWGFDPILLSAERLNRYHLDEIALDRPIAILFSSFHVMCVNGKALELAQYTADTNVIGVLKDQNGEPTGELQEMASMFPVMRRLGIDIERLSHSEHSIEAFGASANRAGVTTITDLFSSIDEESAQIFLNVTGREDFPLRIVAAVSALGAAPSDMLQKMSALGELSTDKFRIGAVKLMTDGSIQGYTARTKWPHYITGHPNGIWNTAPEMIHALCDELHNAGIQMHIHVNGDEASAVALDALDAAIGRGGKTDHRHVLQHCQMMEADQMRRAANLGVCVNAFANHIYYFGDQHAALTIGEDRAVRMNACRTALDEGVHLAIHSDAPVTPLSPLFTAWCAVNRQTTSGRILGEAQCISVEEALYAITLGAAYTLRMDHEIGSIETGKIADFAVLADDPMTVEPKALKDIEVLGTVSGGRVFKL